MEDNKRIAEFMDYDNVDEMFPFDGELHYHSSWDWLMPVLKKIHEQMHPNHRGLWRMITHPFNYDIKDVHNQVVEFIKQLDKE